MIRKITKLKNFGIFHDFTWKNELPEFKQFNLIFAWNRSGKTTISRVFESLEKRCVFDINNFKQYPENGEFEIELDKGENIKNSNVNDNTILVKVFNKDFIDENVSFDPSNLCKPIIYISKEDIKRKNEIEELRKMQVETSKKYEERKKVRESKEKQKDTFLTDLGREIANLLFDKSYNRTKVEKSIKSIGLDNFSDKILSDDAKKKYEEISRSDARNEQTHFNELTISFSFEDEIIDSFQKIFEKVTELLGKKVISETLERLKEDQELNNWVKQGFDLHKKKSEKEKCLFCQKPLDNDFLEKLSKHFSEDYENLQNSIKNLRDKIQNLKPKEVNITNDELYPDLREEYTSKVKKLNKICSKINIWIDETIKSLQEKYDNPFINVPFPLLSEDYLATYNQIISEINQIIDKHNEKVKNHKNEVSNAQRNLELNAIANAFIDVNYKELLEQLEELKKNEEEVKIGLEEVNKKINELERQTSDITIALDDINRHLKDFFGREEIKLELDNNKKGYVIKRNGIPAQNLSEGEKTAIAFSYFIVKVGEKDFDKSQGIIFIDDPISSFDSNFIYHCFSLIKIHFSNVGQLFISTHNFQFFNLVKEWLISKNKAVRKDNEKPGKNNKSEKPIPCEFYMLENFIESEIRKARIVSLDKTLLDYKSEYHFLFTKLKQFSEKQDIQYEDFYTIGNMARRFFDMFADFKIPSIGDQKSKMDVLVKNINQENERISSVNKEKVYKLINEYSHNSDPTSTIEHKHKEEIKEAVKTLLEIVKESDSLHFEILEKQNDFDENN